MKKCERGTHPQKLIDLIFEFVDLKSGQPNSNFSFENRHFLSNRPLIFKFVYLKSGQPSSNSLSENRHFLSHRPPNFLNHFLEISAKVPRPPKVCVDKIGSRPRGNLCVPKIRPGEPERRQTYRDIAISVRKSPGVLLSSFTRPGGRKPAKPTATSRANQ